MGRDDRGPAKYREAPQGAPQGEGEPGAARGGACLQVPARLGGSGAARRVPPGRIQARESRRGRGLDAVGVA